MPNMPKSATIYDEFLPTIGIVIPIYNTAPYLRECLDSVANQTYGDFHAVLVNDGSTDFVSNSSLTQYSRELEKSSIDRQQALSHLDFSAQPTNPAQDTRIADLSKNNISQSLQIALEYVAKDSRFVLIDKENGGQSSARNAGIAYFNGEMESSLQDSTNCIPLSSLRGSEADEAIQKNKKIDCRELTNDDSRNDKSFLDCHDFATQNLAMTSECDSSLRGSVSEANTTKQSKINKSKMDDYFSILTNHFDCYESANADSRNDQVTIHTNITHLVPPKIDYIIFLDSDDFWAVDLLEKCVGSVRIAQQSNCNLDIIWFDWNEIYEDSGRIQGKTTMELFGFATQTQITAKQWLIQAQKKRINSFWWAWQGLIRFDYLRCANLRFLEGVIFEDNLFGVLLFSQCESIAIVPCKLYNYRIRKHSTTNNSAKSLPPFIADLRAHFSTDSEAWAYFCAYSLCAMSLEFANFCANLSEKNHAKPREYSESKLCESIFLPNFLAESCDILAFSSDPLNAKSRFIALLKKRGKYAPYLKIIAHIVPRGFKRLRYALFLFYFAPQFAFFRALRKISRALGFGDG